MNDGVLVVTGGASGIGLACAKAMAGAHRAVALVDANGDGLAAARKAVGGEAQGFECDVADADAQMALADRIEREMGPVTTLVTSAGILDATGTVMDMDLARHARIWEVNYHGVVHSVRAFARGMIGRRRGAILTIGSINSFAPLPLPAYCPGKTAIMRLTQMLAVELGRFGVRVNGVAPTYVLTPALKARIAAGERDPEAIRKSGAIEMDVHPEDIASVAAFLCSDAAKAVTGTMMPVDGGWEAATLYRGHTGGLPWAAKG